MNHQQLKIINLGSNEIKENGSRKYELKQLLDHLQYTFLEKNSTSLEIISLSLSKDEEDKLLKVLREHKATSDWYVADIKGNKSYSLYV